jgi:hypothetical protein
MRRVNRHVLSASILVAFVIAFAAVPLASAAPVWTATFDTAGGYDGVVEFFSGRATTDLAKAARVEREQSSLHPIRRGTGDGTEGRIRRVNWGCVTRLQSSLHAAARKVACPTPTRASTFELSFHESPHWNVEHDYAGNSQFPRPDFHRMDTQPYGLRTDTRR